MSSDAQVRQRAKGASKGVQAPVESTPGATGADNGLARAGKGVESATHNGDTAATSAPPAPAGSGERAPPPQSAPTTVHKPVKPRRRGWYCSCGCVAMVLLAAFLAQASREMYTLFTSHVPTAKDLLDAQGRPLPTITPRWPESSVFDVDVWLAAGSKQVSDPLALRRGSLLHVATIEGGSLDWSLDAGWRAAANRGLGGQQGDDEDDGAAFATRFDLPGRIANATAALERLVAEAQHAAPGSAAEAAAKEVRAAERELKRATAVWDRLRAGGTAHCHVVVRRTAPPMDAGEPPVYAITPMTQVSTVNKPPPPVRFLLDDVRQWINDAFGTRLPLQTNLKDVRPPREDVGERVPHWRPVIDIRMALLFHEYARARVPFLLRRQLQGYGDQYMPIVDINPLRAPTDTLVELNASMTHLPFRVYLSPISVGKWLFLRQIDMSVANMKTMGLQDEDLDEVLRMYAETPSWLLVLTLTISMIHMFFDVLAIKADVSFWRNTKSFAGLSLSSLVTSFICQIVIAAYLVDEEASALVKYPSILWTFLTLWKIAKLLHCSVRRKWGVVPVPILASKVDEVETLSRRYDRVAIRRIGMVLFPLIIGYSVYSLVYNEHKGWYAWLLRTGVQCVYAFGFALMTPQLFINYKLKSVAHLPIRVMVYRSLNTFIDDLFAFIIRMPIMHRISCFRDDLVFVIYMYQRWIYPVDKQRRVVGYASDDDREEDVKRVLEPEKSGKQE